MCTLAILRRSETVPAYLIRKAKTLCDLEMISCTDAVVPPYPLPGIKYGMSDRVVEAEFVRVRTADIRSSRGTQGGLARGIVIRAVCFSLVTRGSTRTRGLSPLLMRGCMYVRLNRGWCVTRNTQTTTPPGQSCTLP